MNKVLLTSVCRPLGEAYGDAPSVGYELLYGQVTRAQGMFSPRSLHTQFSLNYIAENLDAPTVVLQYPSRAELIRELKRGYQYVGISFILATFHIMEEMVALVREHAPDSEIVLGSHGTVLDDDVLAPYGDHFCREEGVAFMRRLLGEPEREMPYNHPMVINPLRVFGQHVSQTGIVFAGLGCANGCDFCCTSHYFKRRHIRLLPTGKDIYDVVLKYHEIDPDMNIMIMDEDFLLNRERAMEFRDCVIEGGKAISVFCFASVRALSRFTVTEIMEMGIDGMWIGYEGTRSGYAKQSGRPVEEVFNEFREAGITVLASMIVGFPYQTPEIIQEELDGLLALKPAFSQFLIYGPVPGTPFFDQVKRENRFEKEVQDDPKNNFWRKGTGFYSFVKHDTMSAAKIEALQADCFKQDYQRLGPSIYRAIEVGLNGYLKWKDSPIPIMRKKANFFAAFLRSAYPAFMPGRLFGPTRETRRALGQLQKRVHSLIGKPNLKERLLGAGAVPAALWTALTLKLNLFQHPKLIRSEYRIGTDLTTITPMARSQSGSPMPPTAARHSENAQSVSAAASSG
ncbi:MAG: radical SAM protein [Planctomycetes bacterium]|nr:radical SAM protein [Planctomycetota bacterium]MCA8945394.1 radical SAM protein [Planctomycetota bacterium]